MEHEKIEGAEVSLGQAYAFWERKEAPIGIKTLEIKVGGVTLHAGPGTKVEEIIRWLNTTDREDSYRKTVEFVPEGYMIVDTAAGVIKASIKRTKEFLFDSCWIHCVILNDTFHYASADAGYITSDDLFTIWGIYEKYGWDAIVAFFAIKRGYDPQIKGRITKEFKAAKKEILVIVEREKKVWKDWITTMNKGIPEKDRKRDPESGGSSFMSEYPEDMKD